MPPKKKDAQIAFTPAPPKPYLLAAKTRARLAASASSSSAMAESPIPIIPAMPVPSAPVISNSVPLAPASSPAKRTDLDQLAASAAKNLVNILASPQLSRSPSASSSSSSPAPGPVGESSRTSISPGAPSPAQEMQQMVKMMQQMKEMVMNVESNVKRSVSDVSDEILQRVNILMGQRDAELTLRVDRMINGLNKQEGVNGPTLILDDNTTLHDYAEEENASLNRSKSEGFVPKTTIDDDSRDEDEYKYDDNANNDEQELPFDDEERRVASRDNNNPDREVMNFIDDNDETHLTDYVQWLKRRERLYPFGNAGNARLYKPRHNLLSNRGRELEYSRFAFLTSWDKNLFGDVANRWFRRLLHDRGVARAEDGKRPRTVSIHLIRVPAMSYDSRDRLIRVTDEEGQDLPPNSFTLGDLPARLRVQPFEDAARIHRRSLQEEAETYVYQRRLAMLSRGEIEEEDNGDETDASMSDSRSIASHDRHTCKKCDKEVYGLVRLCPEHQEESEREKREAEQRRQEDLRRKELALRQQQEKQSQVAATNTVTTPQLSPAPPIVDTKERFILSMTPYGTPIRDQVKQEPGTSTATSSSTHVPAPTSTMPKLAVDSTLTHDRVKQEEEVRALRQKREEFERINTLSDADQFDESTSVLGTILSRAFTQK